MAKILLGDFSKQCIHYFNHHWQQQLEGYWHYKHQELLEIKLQLEQYDTTGFDNLTDKDQLNYISGMIALHGDESVIPLYEKILEKDPDNVYALILKARQLKKTDPQSAMPYY